MLGAVAAAAAGGTAPAATNTTVVTATVLSATSIDPSGCASGSANKTDFGGLLPGASTVTGVDCTVGFSSSNDSAMLRVRQQDQSGAAMWAYSTGTADPAFGAGGMVSTAVGAGDDVGRGVAVQGDGKVLVAGYTFNGSSDDFLVIRYNTDGTLDTSWGGTGKVTTSLSASNDEAFAVALQPDGKVLVGGSAPGSGWGLARYDADGTLDSTFGVGGVETILLDAGGNLNSLLLLPDGTFVGAGMCNDGQFSFCIAKFLPNGSVDTTFGIAGHTKTHVGSISDVARAVAVQSDGKFVVTGQSYNASNRQVVGVVRYLSNGAIDTSWGTAGIATTLISPNADDSTGITIQPDGKVLVAASAAFSSWDAVVLRYSTAGVLDATFGTGGIARSNLPYHDEARAILVQSDGSIVTAGYGGGSKQVMLERLTSTGIPDARFGAGGFLYRVVGIGGNDEAWAAAFGADGSIAVAGTAGNASNLDVGVVRIVGTTVADYGASNWTAGANTFGACLSGISGGGATSVWTVNASCPVTSGAYWNGIPGTALGSKIAQETTPGQTATVAMRFGLRTATSQMPGYYSAPISFDVVAPNL